MPNPKKAQIVEQIKERLSRSNLILLTNYQGLTVQDIENLKKEVEKEGAEYKVVKNSLLRIAGKENLVQQENFEDLSGPTAILFCYEDEIAPLKNLAKFIKELELPKIKFGILGNQILNEEEVKSLASLPNKETLILQVIFGLNSPINKFTYALSYNLNMLVYQLNQIKKQKNN